MRDTGYSHEDRLEIFACLPIVKGIPEDINVVQIDELEYETEILLMDVSRLV